MSRRTMLWGLIGVVAFIIGIQFIPVPGLGQDPPVVAEPSWNSPETRALAVRACYDCHSNETRWPWYSRIAPVSWVVAHHVAEGRAALNFSDPSASRASGASAATVVSHGTMPPFYYTWLHPGASLTASERQTLADGLLASLGGAVAQELAPITPPSQVVPLTDMAPLPTAGPSASSHAGARPGVPPAASRRSSKPTTSKTQAGG